MGPPLCPQCNATLLGPSRLAAGICRTCEQKEQSRRASASRSRSRSRRRRRREEHQTEASRQASPTAADDPEQREADYEKIAEVNRTQIQHLMGAFKDIKARLKDVENVRLPEIHDILHDLKERNRNQDDLNQRMGQAHDEHLNYHTTLEVQSGQDKMKFLESSFAGELQGAQDKIKALEESLAETVKNNAERIKFLEGTVGDSLEKHKSELDASLAEIVKNNAERIKFLESMEARISGVDEQLGTVGKTMRDLASASELQQIKTKVYSLERKLADIECSSEEKADTAQLQSIEQTLTFLTEAMQITDHNVRDVDATTNALEQALAKTTWSVMTCLQQITGLATLVEQQGGLPQTDSEAKAFLPAARGELSSEAYNRLLASLERLKNRQQTREDTLAEAQLLCSDKLNLYMDFERELDR